MRNVQLAIRVAINPRKFANSVMIGEQRFGRLRRGRRKMVLLLLRQLSLLVPAEPFAVLNAASEIPFQVSEAVGVP